MIFCHDEVLESFYLSVTRTIFLCFEIKRNSFYNVLDIGKHFQFFVLGNPVIFTCELVVETNVYLSVLVIIMRCFGILLRASETR